VEETPDLYWSRRGEVACGLHTPDVGSERWIAEQWMYIPDTARRHHGAQYQCQHCAVTRRPLAHRRDSMRASW
jgi:hypothetical protein